MPPRHAILLTARLLFVMAFALVGMAAAVWAANVNGAFLIP